MEPCFLDSILSSASQLSKNENQQTSASPTDFKNKSNIKEPVEEEYRFITDTSLVEFLSTDPPSTDDVDGFASQIMENNKLNDFRISNQTILQSKNNTNSSTVDKTVSETLSSLITTVTRSVQGQNDITNKDASKQSTRPNSDEPITNGYRCPSELWSDDEDSSSSDSSSDSDSFFQIMREGPEPKKVMLVKTKGELELDDLPPIEDLVISLTAQEMELIGKIYAIVEKLVVVRAVKDTKPLDLDSVLFLSHDKPLGRVFDVFGQVEQPFYSVRFNSVEHIVEKGVTVDADVFFAPKKEDITSYVFVDDLQKQKGSDASWQHNNEPPDECLDYSDDEQERAARRQRMIKNRNESFSNSMAKNDTSTKKPLLEGDSPDTPIFIPPPHHPPLPRRNIPLPAYSRPNPFSTPRHLVTPSQTLHMMSPAPAPYIMPRPPNLQPIYLQQGNVLQRPMSPVVYTNYRPPMFGQMTMVSPISPVVHAPPSPAVFYSPVPSPIPGGSYPQQNYFAQRFPRSPSPAPMSPDPWLPNRAPYLQSNLPPNAPLTVQIPPNISSPSPPIHPYQQMNGPVQPFIGGHVPPPFINQHQQVRFSNGTLQTKFY